MLQELHLAHAQANHTMEEYGAVEASSPPTPPKRFGRKLVVALAALGLAGVRRHPARAGPLQDRHLCPIDSPPRRPVCVHNIYVAF